MTQVSTEPVLGWHVVAKRLVRRIARLISSRDTTATFFFSLLTFAVFYRTLLYYELNYPSTDQFSPAGFVPESVPAFMIFGGLASDTKAMGAVAVGFWLWTLACRMVVPVRFDTIRRLIATVSAGSLLVLFVASYVAHHELLWQLGTGISRTVLTYGLRNAPVTEYLSYMTSAEWLLLAGALGIVLFHQLSASRFQKPLRVAVLVVCALSFGYKHKGSVVQRTNEAEWSEADRTGKITSKIVAGHDLVVGKEIFTSPVTYLIHSMKERPGRFDTGARPPSTAQARSSGFVDSMFIGPRRPALLSARSSDSNNLNLLMIQMESVSYKYAFGAHSDGKRFMPFMDSLLPRSVVLDRHYSTGVDTDHAVFSVFSGLFTVAEPIRFTNRADLRVPTLFSFLPSNYQRFLVTPSDLRVVFPEALLRNTGLRDVVDARNSRAAYRAQFGYPSRDEEGSATVLAEKIAMATEPFAAVYYPYATHWPYSVADTSASQLSKRDRYVFNLRLVDTQIKRLFDALRDRAILDRTIVVITADHGEAFGDQGVWVHGNSVNDILLHVPMVIYAPAIVTPQRVNRTTSHVDVLPTLLDAMGIAYDSRSLEGESLLRPQTRLYSFFYAPWIDHLGSIDIGGLKLVADFKHDSCWTVNLAADPEEVAQESCDEASPQFTALMAFRRYHTSMLFNITTAQDRTGL